MTLLERIDHLRALAIAEAAGKTIERRTGDGWKPTTLNAYRCSALEYNEEFRIAPEPRVRPWTAEEVPVGKMVKFKTGDFAGCRSLITSAGRLRVRCGDGLFTADYLLDNATCEDGSPCGVVES